MVLLEEQGFSILEKELENQQELEKKEDLRTINFVLKRYMKGSSGPFFHLLYLLNAQFKFRSSIFHPIG